MDLSDNTWISALIQIPFVAVVLWAWYKSDERWRTFLQDRDKKFNDMVSSFEDVVKVNTEALARYQTMEQIAALCREIKKELQTRNGG